MLAARIRTAIFLSSLAQDFIEVDRDVDTHDENGIFLSSLAQDFIEVDQQLLREQYGVIPELSSSGLH